MVEVIIGELFERKTKKIKDPMIKRKIQKLIAKITVSPEIGKPMKYARKGTREVYLSPFRISYQYKEDKITLVDLYHKDGQ